MKKIVLSFIFSIAAVSQSFGLPQRFYSLKAKLPIHLKDVKGSLPVYYKGHKIDLTQGWTKLPECAEPCTFSLLITENVDFVAKGNTVRYLKRIPDQNHVWYDLTLSFHDEPKDENVDHTESPAPSKKTYSWSIEKHDSDETPERIPEHTIVLLTNPDFIDSLKTETSLPGAIDIVLPTIVFKDDIDPELFQESVLNILMGPAMGLGAIHRKDSPICVTCKDTVVISATKQNYATR
jgi:hypothetical protein